MDALFNLPHIGMTISGFSVNAPSPSSTHCTRTHASAFVKNEQTVNLERAETCAAVTERVRRHMVTQSAFSASNLCYCQQILIITKQRSKQFKTDTHTRRVSCVRSTSANHLTPRKQEKRIGGSTDVTEGWRWSTSAAINPQQRNLGFTLLRAAGLLHHVLL